MRGRFHLPSLLRAMVIFGLLMGFFVPILAMRSKDSEELLTTRLNLLAMQIGHRFEEQVTVRVGVLQFFGETLPALKVETYEQFADWARPVRHGIAGFYAINFINLEHIIQWVEPLEANRAALGKNPVLQPGFKLYLDDAEQTRTPRMTHFAKLFQGLDGFAVYIPVVSSGVVQGFVNGVFALGEFVPQMVVPRMSLNYVVKISTPAFKGSPNITIGVRPEGDAVGRYESTLYGQQIVFEVRPTASEGVEQLVDRATSLVIGGALLSALILSGVSYMFMRSQSRLRERLEQERFQGALLNLLVHDILNPLLVIRYGADEVGRVGDAAVHAQLAKIYYGIDQLHDVTTRVRDLRAIELGKARLTLVPVPINDIIRDALKAFEPRMKEKGLIPDFELSIDNPSILVDRVIFQNNVIGNVLSNACKFAEPGTSIKMSTRPRGDQVLIEIEDQGVGMSQELVSSLFEEGLEASKLGTQGEPGTGIGMLQIKAYVRFFGGRVVVHSRPKDRFPDHHGTFVCLYLPRA